LSLGNGLLLSTTLSFCHPDRTRISCHAALDGAACAAFFKESSMKCANAIKFHRKSGGGEGSAVRHSGATHFYRSTNTFSFVISEQCEEICGFALHPEVIMNL
jgi:hypothetical protein